MASNTATPKDNAMTKGGASQIEPTGKESPALDKDKLLNSLGASGVQINKGVVYDDYNFDLTGLNGLRIYDRMRRSDAQVYASLLVIELPIRAAIWDIQPATNEDGNTDDALYEHADFIKDALFNKQTVTWDQLLVEIMTMVPNGFSIFEKVFTVIDGKIYLKKLASRKQTTILRWETPEGTPGVTQNLPSPIVGGPNEGKTQVGIPAEKLVIFTFRKEGDNYNGVSALRSAHRHYFYKDNFYKFDAIKHERQSVGVPIIYLPSGATDEDKAQAKIIVENIRTTQQTGIVMPGPKADGWEFEFADMKAGTTSNMWEAINHHNREISKNVLAQFLELGNTQSGSYALGESQQDLFLLSLNALARQIADIFNRFVIPELIDLNFDNVKEYPKLTFQRIGSVDYAKVSEALAKLASGGLLTVDDGVETFVRQMMQLPAKEAVEEDETDEQEEDATILPQPPETEPKDPAGDAPAAGDAPTDQPAAEDGNAAVKSDATKDDVEQMKKQPPAEQKKFSHDHHHDGINVFDDAEFMEVSKRVNNQFILGLQNECRTAEDKARMRHVGFKFNDYESQSPRIMTFAERKVNFTSLQRSMSTFESILEEKLADITKRQKEDLLQQVKRAVEANDIKAVGKIKAKYTGEMSQALTDVQKELFEIGKVTAASEMGVAVPPTKAEVRGAMRVQNDALVESLTKDMETAATTSVTQVAAKRGGSITSTGTSEAVSAASASLDKVIGKNVSSLRTLGVTGSVNLGRSSIYEKYPEKIFAMQFSAILDQNTTDTCRSLDGRVVSAGSQEFYDYSPPRHEGCRSIWVEILQDEAYKPGLTGIPSSIPANQTVDTYQKMQAPDILKDSPARKQVEQELADRKEKLQALQDSGKFQNRQDAHQARIDQLEGALKKADAGSDTAFKEYCRSILRADGVTFND